MIFHQWFMSKICQEETCPKKNALNDKCSTYLNLIGKAVRKPTILIVGKWKPDVVVETNSNLTIYDNVSCYFFLEQSIIES